MSGIVGGRIDVIGQNGNTGDHYLDGLPGDEVPGDGVPMHEDTGSHYRREVRVPVTRDDWVRGYVRVKLDPYRICQLYRTGGGPREHIVKKGLRGTSKGDSERGLIQQLRDALNRWEEILDEDEEAQKCWP